MSDSGLQPQIEPTCYKPNGDECTPDLVIEETTRKTIIEHKASLSDRSENVQDVLEEVYDNYYPLIENSNSGQVGALFPKSDESTVQLIIHFLNEDFILSTFLMMMHPSVLQLFTLKGEFQNESLKGIFSSEHPFVLTEFAKYKLIRSKPPVPFSAEIIWNLVLLPLYGESGEFKDEAIIEYESVLEQTKTQVRGYGQGAENNLRGVVNRALKFLDSINWAKFNGEDNPITIYPKKGKGQGQVLRLFCEKWFQFKTAGQIEDDEDEDENDGYVQNTLE